MEMGKGKLMLIVCGVVLLLSACGQVQSKHKEKNIEGNIQENVDDIEEKEEVEIKVSPDKYTWYIKNYVGRNVASFGYTSVGGDRIDTYGAGYLRIIFVDNQGKYIDINNEDELKKYVVVNQNIIPNTEMKYVFEKNDEGQEYDALIEHQSYEEIVLTINHVGESEKLEKEVMKINSSPNKYTQYIRDYSGRNAADCGYISMGGDFRDSYGAATVKLILIPEDGSYIDISNDEIIKEYKVTKQSVEPNTELDLVFMKNEKGEEYSNLVDSQNINEIELYVEKVKGQ